MTKKLFIILPLITLLFTSCEQPIEAVDISTSLDGVVINGTRWATRNVDAPGTFTQNPEDAGMLFQWNRRKGWNTVDRSVKGWDRSRARGRAWYAENDPCPEGWRVPTRRELRRLERAVGEWVSQNGVYGRLFGIAPNQIFLPAVRVRCRDGILYHANLGNWWSGDYWSGTRFIAGPAWLLSFDNARIHYIDTSWLGGERAWGRSVRCVAIE